MKKATEGRADKREVGSETSRAKRRRTGKILPATMLVAGILVIASGIAGFAVSRSLARTDRLREAELDQKILAEASRLSDSAVDRLSLAAAWAQAAQIFERPLDQNHERPLDPQREQQQTQRENLPRPPVAAWHLGSTVIREQTPAGTGLRARLNGAPWMASRLSDGNIQILSRLEIPASEKADESDSATPESRFLVSTWKEGLVSDILSSQATRSDSGTIVARLWLSPDESLGSGSREIDSAVLRSAFAGEKLRGYGALALATQSGRLMRRFAFDRSEKGSVVATVDAASPRPTILFGWIQAASALGFAVSALAGTLLVGIGAALLLRASASASAREKLTEKEPVLAETPDVASRSFEAAAASRSGEAAAGAAIAMGVGAESAGAPVFIPSPGSSRSLAFDSDDATAVETEELRDLRLRVVNLEREIEAARRVIRVMQDEDRVVFEFERDAAQGRDARALGERLAKAASKLSGSPALFLQFQAPLGALSLVAESGVASNLVPAQLHIPIEATACDRISELAQEGSIPSLSGYEPLAQAVLRHFGASHFDAWAITGYSWLGRAAGKPKLLGVLVLLQPGSETLTRVRSLGRMVRNVGLLFENTLISQQ